MAPREIPLNVAPGNVIAGSFCKSQFMSLVVAKKEDSRIYIVSDTKLTNPQNLNRVKLAAPEEFSAIKTAIINPFISISFAGDVTYANSAISVCRNLYFKVNEILSHLLKVNIN